MSAKEVEVAKISRKTAIVVALITMVTGVVTALITTKSFPKLGDDEKRYGESAVLVSSVQPEAHLSSDVCVSQSRDLLEESGYQVLKNGKYSIVARNSESDLQIGVRCYKGIAFFYGTGDDMAYVSLSIRALRESLPDR